jgi:predicted acylesterase/phospholipase RssA
LTPRKTYQGFAPLDGGLVSNAPVDYFHHSQGDTLVLLTRQSCRVPSVGGRVYVQPSQPMPVGAWDYTNARAIQATYDLGQRDAENFCQKWGRIS